jgi:hypothetical protein
MENYHDYSAVGYSLSLNESMAIRCVKSNPTLTVNPAPTSVPHTGGTASISFDSSITGVKQGLTETTAAAPWTAQFSLDGGATWTTTAPEWIDGFPTSGTGSLPPTSYTVGTAPVTGISPDFEGESALGTQAAPYDLSTENGARPRETANSYVVNGPGYYKLPLVYGNAVKNGAPNEAAYRSTLGNPTITVPNMVYLTRFLRHDGQPIADPYINANSFAGGVATNATLVWSDVPGMVAVDAAIASEGGVDFLTFRVSDESIAQGNAVVAVRNTAGQIMWSWHIWVTEPRIADMHKAEALAQAQLTENRSTTMSTSYKMMANNLGWVEARENTHAARTVQVRITQQATGGMSKTFAIEQAAGSSTLGANNPYWQFGRKDPMLPSNGHAGHGGEREAIEYGAGYAAPEMIRKRDGSIANAIQNPNVFYLAATNFGTARWNHTGTGDGNSDAKDVINLWSMDDVDPALNSEVVKTVYDPSPVGFTVPNKDVFTGFTSTGGEINEKTDWNIPDPSTNSLGQKFHLGLAKTGDTAFYPEMGDRGVDDGILYNVNNGGNAFYHTASMLGETFCVGLLFTSAGTYLNPKYGNFISRGSSVRPAAEVTP